MKDVWEVKFHREKLTVQELAAAAFLSERECFRAFRDAMGCTPSEYRR